MTNTTKESVIRELKDNPRKIKLACIMLEISKLHAITDKASMYLPYMLMSLIKELIGDVDANVLIDSARDYALELTLRERATSQKLNLRETEIN